MNCDDGFHDIADVWKKAKMQDPVLSQTMLNARLEEENILKSFSRPLFFGFGSSNGSAAK